MKRWAASENCFPLRWTIASGRESFSSLNCTTHSVSLFTSVCTAGSGTIATPCPTSTKRLIVSMLSTSAT